MSKWDRLREKILSGRSDADIPFGDLCHLLLRAEFEMHISGSHHIFEKVGYPLINLQPAGKNAKPYQVKQVRQILEGNPNLKVR